jgi:spermidine synthase
MRRIKSFALTIFFISGAAGLIYEVVWSRMLTLVFGSTVYATSTVLTVFMGGLALGSFYLGRRIDRFKRPLLVYAVLEAGIGIFALLFPFILDLLSSIYVTIHRSLGFSFYAISLIRFILAFLVLLIPTTLMGATLPAISRGVAKRMENLGWDVGGLYSINTFGAMVGTLSAGFALIRFIGIPWTIGFAAFLNFLAAGVAVYLQRKLDVRDEKVESPSTFHPLPLTFHPYRNLALWITGVSGFCALAYEVFWTRILVFFLGSTTYAFATMLSAFLFGIAVGSFLFARLADRWTKTLLALGVVQMLIGTFAMMLLPLFGEVYSIGALFRRPNWFNFIMGRFLPASVMMFPPTFLMGATFPLVVKLFVAGIPRLSRDVGSVYAANTLGAIFGAFLAGFIVIPLVGIQRGVLVVSLLNIGLGWWLLQRSGLAKGMLAATLMVLLGAEAALLVVSHRPIVLKSAIFRYQRPKGKLLFYEEGVDASVTVLEDEDGTKLLYVDTNQAAEDSRWDSPSHRVIAHLPLLLHPNPKRALVVGFGMGVTSYSITQHNVKVDAVEISPGVVKAAKRFFTHVNGNIFENPLLQLFVEDGRNFILTTDRKYDMISTGIIHPLVSSGSSNIYSRDFYELCKRILTPDGVMSQWVPLHRLPEEHFKMIIRTFIEVFPHTTLWYKYTPDFVVLIGTPKPLRVNYREFLRRANMPGVREGLAHDDLDAISLLDSFMMDEKTVRRFVGPGEIHTDAHPHLEFFGPGLSDTTARNIEAMKPFRQSVIPYLTNYGDTPQQRKEVEGELKRYFDATQILIDAQIEYAKHNYERAAELAYRAWGMNPQDGTIRYNMEVARKIAIAQIDAQLEKIAENLRRRVRANPNDIDSHRKLGAIYQEMGKVNDAISAYREVKRLDPNDLQARLSLGVLYEERGELDRAIREYKEASKLAPGMPLVHGSLATLYQRKGELDRAIEEIKRVLEKEPDLALAHSMLGSLYMEKGQEGKAISELKRALELDPNLLAPRVNLASIYSGRGMLNEAEKVLREALKVNPNVYEVRLGLARVLLEKGEFQEALDQAKMALSLRRTEEAEDLINLINSRRSR